MIRYCPTHGPVAPLRGIPAGRIVAHVVLTACSCGVWLPLWLIDIAASAAVARCPICGQATKLNDDQRWTGLHRSPP